MDIVSSQTASSNGYEQVETGLSVSSNEVRSIIVESTHTVFTNDSLEENCGYEVAQTHIGSQQAGGSTIVTDNGNITRQHCRFFSKRSFGLFLSKLKGVPGEGPPKRKPIAESVFSFLLLFLAILALSTFDTYLISKYFETNRNEVIFLAAFHAGTGVTLFDQYQSPVAQPRCVLGGYFVCSFTGVSIRYLGDELGINSWLVAAIATALSVLLMDITRTIHPPAAACCLFAVIGNSGVRDMGFWYVGTVMLSAAIMLAIAIAGNNVLPSRQYPLYWF